MTSKPLPPDGQQKAYSAANKRHLCVYGCVWEGECGSVPHIVCNVTRKDNDLQAQVFQADSILWCRCVVAWIN